MVVGLSDGRATTKDVVKINLHRSNEISKIEKIWPSMPAEVVAADVYCNTVYVTGVGLFNDQIWKYNVSSGWKECGSLVQGRRGHSATFIDEVLYICGGHHFFSVAWVLHSVEAFNAVTKKCSSVGKLFHSVIMDSGNCVPFKVSLYIFDCAERHVQMYNTKENTCSALLRSMPIRCIGLFTRAVLWETSVIFFGRDTCFLFNIETKTWQEREHFKTDVSHFGLIIENERIFVVGGGISGTDTDGKTIWKCIDDVRYVPLKNIFDDKPTEWKIHGKLPKPSLVHACTLVRFFV